MTRVSPLLVVLGFALLAAACGPICGQREPYIYTLVTPDGEYILAMVQSPEPFASRFGYETSPAELELLARYPTSGIYANDESAEMVVPIAQPFPESAVVALYAREEHVVLVARNSFGLTFFRDGREKVEVDGVNEEWGGAPWYASQAAGLACDAWKLDVSLERAATQSLIRVRFG